MEQINLLFWGVARDEERVWVGAGGVAERKQPTENVAKKVCAHGWPAAFSRKGF